MLSNSIRTSVRAIKANGIFSILNVVGLGIGLACAGLILLWVEDELSFNKSFQNGKRISIIKHKSTYDGITFTFDATPGPLAPALEKEVPGIKHAARLTWPTRQLFTVSGKPFYFQGHYADVSFLNIFKLDFIDAPTDTFSDPNSVLLSKKAAETLFGTSHAKGKIVTLDNNKPYTVKGVFANLPDNISFDFDWLASFPVYEKKNTWLQAWTNNGIQTFVELEKEENFSGVNKAIDLFVKNKAADADARLFLYPMSRWRLYNKFNNGFEEEGRIKYVRLFSIIGWVILIIACINFMNLATARSEKRAKEVGVRKALGAERKSLIYQFISESIILSFISALLSLLIMFLLLGPFNELTEKNLSLDLFTPSHIIILVLLILISGIISGSYPAFYLSSFNPTTVLKGTSTKGPAAANIRRGLVIFQFSISAILIICSILITLQIRYVQSRDLGYNKEQLVYVPVRGNMKQTFPSIRNELQQQRIAVNASLSKFTVAQIGQNTGGVQWTGKDPGKEALVSMESISPEYLPVTQIRLLAGRNFKADINSDSSNVIINKTLADLIGKDKALGIQISFEEGSKYNVIGIAENHYYNNIYTNPAPLVFFCDTSNASTMTVRLTKEAMQSGGTEKMQAIISKFNPGYPVEFEFADDRFMKFFKTETMLGKLSMIFTVLAIVISCLGLIGLAAFTAERRKKELSIRKVLGASTLNLCGLISMDFIKLILFACIIAYPVSWMIMSDWLSTYEYRISIQWWVYLMTLSVITLIALVSVGYHAIRASHQNPVDNLRAQ